MLIYSIGFSIMTLFVKLSGDLPSIQKTFFRNFVSAIIAFIFVIYNKESLFGKKENQLVLLGRSIFGTLGIIFLFYAIDHLVMRSEERRVGKEWSSGWWTSLCSDRRER